EGQPHRSLADAQRLPAAASGIPAAGADRGRGLAQSPAGIRVTRSGAGDIRRPDEDREAGLNLLDVNRLDSVRPAIVELDFAKERVEVRGRERVAHLRRIGRGGALDRDLERE